MRVCRITGCRNTGVLHFAVNSHTGGRSDNAWHGGVESKWHNLCAPVRRFDASTKRGTLVVCLLFAGLPKRMPSAGGAGTWCTLLHVRVDERMPHTKRAGAGAWGNARNPV